MSKKCKSNNSIYSYIHFETLKISKFQFQYATNKFKLRKTDKGIPDFNKYPNIYLP